jgi:hypothetical protein
MVMQGAIAPKQVNEHSPFLRIPILRTSTSPTRSIKHAELVVADGASCRPSQLESHKTLQLYAGVQSRLATLRERIQTCGKAVLRPSNAIMGQPFGPDIPAT